MIISFTLNGQPRELDVDGTMRALDILREHCGVTGTKEGCGSGECGACAIWIDGVTKLSCLILAAQLDGHAVTTIEGIADGQPHPIQTAMAECGGVQCGYCAPGIVMTAAQLLKEQPQPDRNEIRHRLSGNLCRCTGYHKILDAVEIAAARMRKED